MSLKTKIDLVFAITALIVTVLLYVTFQNVSYVKESSDLVNKSNEFLYNLENLESSVSKVEANSRGYIISGNDGFLDNMEQGKVEVYKNLEATRRLLYENQPIIEHFNQLEQLVYEKIKVSDHSVDLRRTQSMESAIEFVSTGKGKMLMDHIADLIGIIEKEELGLLSLAIHQNEIHAVNQNNIYKALSLCIFAIIFFFHLHIRKNTFKVFGYKEKQAQLISELNHQNKQLDDFVHIITHNVRSPANNISSLVSILDDHDDPEECKLILDKLKKVSQNLNETLDELIEVIQIKQNTGIVKHDLLFKELFDKITDTLQGDIIMKGASITYDFDECPHITYPKVYLESIMHNLLSNALKYSSPERKPEIHVSTHIINGQPVMKVRDNGLGMDLKRIGDKIFGLRKMFHTTENAKGIGLFMTKTHIDALGGEIKVDSKVNMGSTFTVFFKKEKPSKLVEALNKPGKKEFA